MTTTSFVIGLLGDNIGGSLAKPLQEGEGEAQGLSLAYRLVDATHTGLGLDDTADVLRWAIRLGFDGLAVTHPFKNAVMACVDEATPEAQALGASNLVVVRDGRSVGTTPTGSASRRRCGRRCPRRSATGWSCSVPAEPGWRSATARCGTARPTSRSSTRTSSGPRPWPHDWARWSGRDRVSSTTDLAGALRGAGGLIQATPVGMDAHPGLPFDPALLRPDQWVADIIYFPLETELVHRARAAGCRVMTGGAMAVHQHAAAFALLTGRPADIRRMQEHFEALTGQQVALSQRHGLGEACGRASRRSRWRARWRTSSRPSPPRTSRASSCSTPTSPPPRCGPRRWPRGAATSASRSTSSSRCATSSASRPPRSATGCGSPTAKFEVMERLGATRTLLCSAVHPEASADLDLAAEQLATVGQRAADHGFTVAFEALAWGTFVNRVGQAWRVVENAGLPEVGLAVDTFHLLARGDDAAALEGMPGDRIEYLQVADAPHLAMDVLEWSRHHRCFPGQGSLDVVGVVAAVVEAGYRGPLSLEVFNDIVREAEPHETARDAMRSLLFLEEQLRRHWDGARAGDADRMAGSRTRPLVELFDPPAEPECPTAAFVEIAADPRSERVPDLLYRWGFVVHGGGRRGAPGYGPTATVAPGWSSTAARTSSCGGPRPSPARR